MTEVQGLLYSTSVVLTKE